MGDFGHGRGEGKGFSGSNIGRHSSDQRGKAPTLQVGNEFDVTIDKLGHKGDGMVSVEGMTVFVKNVEAGEQVKIKIYKVMDTIAFAERQ